MQTIIAILRASHCRSTHHYLAIDAIQETTTEPGQRLGRMLLSHFKQYLQGAKDPDNAFKDFENHVVHVQDGFWGGAAKTAERWKERIHQELSQKKWSDAAYSIGVLSHYFSDPFMPLHTGQTPKEAIVHRPLEWSICCAYQQIYQMALNDSLLQSLSLPIGETWLTDTILAGANLANKFYDAMIDEYDMSESHRNPPLALREKSRKILSQIFVWVLTGWGAAIDRIANESKVSIPEFSLALPTVLATVRMPVQKIVTSIANQEQRNEVAAILHEYLNTGNVVANQTPEQRKVKSVKQLSPTYGPSESDLSRVRTTSILAYQVETNHFSKPAVSPANKDSTDTSRRNSEKVEATMEWSQPPSSPPATAKPILQRVAQSPTNNDDQPDSAASSAPNRRRQPINLTSPIVDAPAIGPKTAARLEAIGVHSISDLLSHDSEQIAKALRTNWITPKLVENWQSQTRLAVQIPRLPASGVGLLVLAGIETAEQLTSIPADLLHERIIRVSRSSEGTRLLRNKQPPSIAHVARWQNGAKPESSFVAEESHG